MMFYDMGGTRGTHVLSLFSELHLHCTQAFRPPVSIMPVLLRTTEPNVRCMASCCFGQEWLLSPSFTKDSGPPSPQFGCKLTVVSQHRRSRSFTSCYRDFREISIASITRYHCRGPQKRLLGDESRHCSIQQCRSPIKVVDAPKRDTRLPSSVCLTFISRGLVYSDNSVGSASR